MLIEPLIRQLHDLRLKGMAACLEQQRDSGDRGQMAFEDRLGLMIQQEQTERASLRLGQRLRWAKLPMNACLEDLDTRAPRGVDPAQLAQVTDLSWIREHLNLLVTGPTGVGKSYLAAALAHAACRADFSVRCFRLPRLVDELARYTALHKRSNFFRQIAKADLLVLDDFGLAPLADQTVRDLLEILMTAMTGARPSSPANFPSINGTLTSVIARSPTPSSIDSSTTRIASRSKANQCANRRPRRPPDHAPTPRHVDERQENSHSCKRLATPLARHP
jgi:DNA replication protein DnaC